jgi:hypothetical protein
MRAKAQFIKLAPRNIPLLGDEFSGDPLINESVILEQLRRVWCANYFFPPATDEKRDAAHMFDTARQHNIMDAGCDECRTEVNRLLRRTALTVNSCCRRLGRKPGL